MDRPKPGEPPVCVPAVSVPAVHVPAFETERHQWGLNQAGFDALGHIWWRRLNQSTTGRAGPITACRMTVVRLYRFFDTGLRASRSAGTYRNKPLVVSSRKLLLLQILLLTSKITAPAAAGATDPHFQKQRAEWRRLRIIAKPMRRVKLKHALPAKSQPSTRSRSFASSCPPGRRASGLAPRGNGPRLPLRRLSAPWAIRVCRCRLP
jgi:hypothetical protein